jgi:hypothetical protein
MSNSSVDTPYLLRAVQWIHSILQGDCRGCQKDSGRYHARDSRTLCAGQAARFRRRVRFEVTSGECDGSRRRNVDQGLALERAQQPPGGPYCVHCKSSFLMGMTGMPLLTHSCSAADLAGGRSVYRRPEGVRGHRTGESLRQWKHGGALRYVSVKPVFCATLTDRDVGLGTSSVVGPALVGRLASEFLNVLYIA